MTTPAAPATPETIEGLSATGAAAFVKLVRGMANSKDMNEKVQFFDMASKVDPTIVVPTDVQLERFQRTMTAKQEADKIEENRKSNTARLEAQRKYLVDSGRYDDATVKKIEDEIMTPRGISDYETGAILYAHEHPEPEVSPPNRGMQGSSWQMPWANESKDDVKKMIADPRGYARNKAASVVTELRRKRA